MSEIEYQENIHFIISHPEAVAREMTKRAARITELEIIVALLQATLFPSNAEVKDAEEWLAQNPDADPAEYKSPSAARIERLEEALRYALANGVGTQYSGDDDNCGTHSCCGEVSYKPHDTECWTVKARAALGEEPSK